MPKQDCSIDMTMCPECVQYIRHCAGYSRVECPFCEATFSPSEAKGKSPSASSVRKGLKQGVMAASFVGATVLGGVACGGESVAHYGMPVMDAGDQPDAGPSEDVDSDDVTEDVATEDVDDNGDAE